VSANRKSKAGSVGGEPGSSAELSFEEALERLERLVERLEEGKVPLEESLAAYAEGTRLVKLCLARLEKAELLIKELGESAGGFRLAASPLQGDLGESGGERDDDEATEQNELEF
jgi:exodeoxyribonuclease VII small subunit